MGGSGQRHLRSQPPTARAMPSPLALALSLLLSPLPALSCFVPPESCPKSKCSALPTKYPNPSWNFSLNSTWSSAQMSHVAFYRGVFNKLYGGSAPRDGTRPDWEALRDKAVASDLFVNLEKFPLEAEFVLSGPTTRSLSSCCDLCRVTEGCVLYLFRPAQTTYNFDLTSSTAGACYLLKGGRYTGDGPFDPSTGRNYGTPNSGSNSAQGSSNLTPMGYVGGFCNPNPSVTDDPHFVGAHGTRFDFNGQLGRSYCLVSDRRVQINVLLEGYTTESSVGATVGTDGRGIRSWIREVGVLWIDAAGQRHSLRLVSRRGPQTERGTGFLALAELDGAPVVAPSSPGDGVSLGDMSLTFLEATKKGPYDMEKFKLRIGGLLEATLTMRVAHQLLRTEADAQAHLNLILDSFEPTESVHGVLGQTYRNAPEQIRKAVEYSALSHLLSAPIQADGASGVGFLEGRVEDYITSDVLSAACKFSSFGKDV